MRSVFSNPPPSFLCPSICSPSPLGCMGLCRRVYALVLIGARGAARSASGVGCGAWYVVCGSPGSTGSGGSAERKGRYGLRGVPHNLPRPKPSPLHMCSHGSLPSLPPLHSPLKARMLLPVLSALYAPRGGDAPEPSPEHHRRWRCADGSCAVATDCASEL